MADDFDIRKLEFYVEKEAKRTMVARAVLLTLIVSMLGANMWLTQRNHESMLVNINQTRLEQVTLEEGTERDLLDINHRLDSVETELAACTANNAAVLTDEAEPLPVTAVAAR